VVIGEGGSGGAIALAAANRVLMLEHSIYSVISPEGCASILWRSGEQAQGGGRGAAPDGAGPAALGVIDDIIPEPLGGAHRGAKMTIAAVGDRLESGLRELLRDSGPQLKQARRQKFLDMGQKGLG
jgi:acetyl-CoA carboxylase carboxyl transferase subunit alpha